MHELSIAISIVDEVSSMLASSAPCVVNAVYLQLGRLSGVDKAALLFCYSAACEGTLLAGSRLVVEEIPVSLFCSACNLESEPESMQRLVCPVCRDSCSVLRGYEMDISQMELAA